MDLLYLSLSATLLCGIVILSLRYLSLLRWVGGQAYVLSKKLENFTILEVLELFKNAKPFPVSYQKGWKIHNFIHGHRVWTHFLTFTSARSAPCIKVYATFDRVSASAQSILQLIKDASLSCEWKPGVIAARSVHELAASEWNGRSKWLPSQPVQRDNVRVERAQPPRYHWPWRQSDNANIVIPTVIEDYKRFWHREDNGCSWLLQMDETSQSFVFYLIQPVEELDHCLLTVVTWSSSHTGLVIPADEAPSVLLSSLNEYIQLRRLQMTPLLQISLPHHVVVNDKPTTPNPFVKPASSPPSKPSEGGLFSRFRQFVDQYSSSGKGSGSDAGSKAAIPESIRRSSSILRYRSSGNAGGLLARSGLAGDNSHAIKEEEEVESDFDSDEFAEMGQPSDDDDLKDQGAGDTSGAKVGLLANRKKAVLQRSHSEGPRHSPSPSPPRLDFSPKSEAAAKAIARYQTMINQAAAELLAEAFRASNIDLEKPAQAQAESSNGWVYSSFENNVVVLKKIPPSGSSVQSYLGKGFVLAPPKTVWDAIRNPRTRFTYDDTLKKVDILEHISDGIKVVYLYQEVLGLLRKESCDVCCLQGERVEASKYILAYTSIEHDSAPVAENTIRAQMLPSGWIIESVRKDNRLYSLVTYLMQVDYGPSKSGSDRLPLEEMMCRQPISISYLQQYLKPAVQLARRKSAPVIPL
ncbi:hypothetical protein BaRGS_00020133 [Batillaria attramentaria]|uniref:START domain-containing protein n=1 Tax=Batillaria attramentaria TaxID=370345 RepID=A0ABD0KPF7_9CAEN